MQDIVELYLKNRYKNISLSALRKESNNKMSNGFIINKTYYSCVDQIAEPLQKANLKKHTCSAVMKSLGIKPTEDYSFSCNNCLLQCIENAISDNPSVKLFI